jgi:hypothetical protein
MWASVALPLALLLPRGRPSGTLLPSPRQAVVRGGEKASGRGHCSQFPGGIWFLPQTPGALTSPAVPLSPPSSQFPDC